MKEVFEMEWYLQENFNRKLRQYFSKIRLSSHKPLIKRGRWMKPVMEHIDRLCTLYNAKDIEDEYHVLMICYHYKTLRMKFAKKFYYQRPSEDKFHKILKTTKKRDSHRLMTFAKLVLKDYNNQFTCTLYTVTVYLVLTIQNDSLYFN